MWDVGVLGCIIGVYPIGLIKVVAYMGGSEEKSGMDSNPVKDLDMGEVECIGGGVGCTCGGVGYIGGCESRIGINKDESRTSSTMNLVR